MKRFCIALAIMLVGCAPPWMADTGVGNDLFRQGRLEEALARYEAVVASHPSPAASYNLGTALASLRRDDEALKRLDSAVTTADPAVAAPAQYNRGIVLFRMGDCEHARDAFAAALQLAPADQDASFNLGIVDRALAVAPGQPGAACKADRSTAGQPSESGDGTGREQVIGQGDPDSGGEDQPGGVSEQMRRLLAQLQQGAGNRATELNSDHPNMTLDEALRLLDEVRGGQGGFDELMRGSSGVIQP
jgi:tetratricopeptide (TPR) repeat protein